MKTQVIWEGKTITISSRHIGIDTPQWSHGYKKHHFKITVECDGRKFTEDYWQPDQKMTVRGLREVLECCCSDAISGDMSIDDFQSEFGYEKASELIRVYNACKSTLGKFKYLFIDPYELSNYLREKYDI